MLLIDQNLPLALAESLKENFPGTVHAKEMRMERSTDSALWDYAREKNLVIVTKDSDFYERLSIKGFPPRLIWVRTGNVSTTFLIHLFKVNTELVRGFIGNAELGYLEML